jgi:hypothetical protein
LTPALFRHAPTINRPRTARSVLSHFDDTPKRKNGREQMESIWGKQSCVIDAATLAMRIAGYRDILIDIGTGDGQYVRHVAREYPTSFAIGIDACRENLRRTSQRAPCNALYIIANALTLPRELSGLATRITVNFPWGSLLAALLGDDGALRDGLIALARPGATLEIRLNRGALAEAGYPYAAAVTRIQQVVHTWGFDVRRSNALGADALRECPTTWAKRLAYGRDPCGWYLSATRRALCAPNGRTVYSEQPGASTIAPSYSA